MPVALTETLPESGYVRPGDKEPGLTDLELEMLRLADLDDLAEGRAAKRMKMSPAAFRQILKRAHRKIASRICDSRGFSPPVDATGRRRTLRCDYCGRVWQLPCYERRPDECPRCHRDEFHEEFWR